MLNTLILGATLNAGAFSKYIKNCLMVDLADYFDIGMHFYINLFLLAIFIAFIGVSFATNHFRRSMYIAVKQLSRHNAVSEESAKTLSEIGLKDNKTVKRFLSGDSQLTAVVLRVGEKRYTYEEYLAAQKKGQIPKETVDFKTARFYLSEKAMPRVKRIMNSYNVSTVQSVVFAILILFVYVGVSIIVPDILAMLGGF